MVEPTILVLATPSGWSLSRRIQDELDVEGINALHLSLERSFPVGALESVDGVVLVFGDAGGSDREFNRAFPIAQSASDENTYVMAVASAGELGLRPSGIVGLKTSDFIGYSRHDDLDVVAARAVNALLAKFSRHMLARNPPAERPKPEDAGVVVAQTEGLLVWAGRFVDDEAQPEELRDEVDARRRQLRDELRLIEQGRGSSAVLTGISGALLDLVRPDPSEDALGAALDEVADGVVALGAAGSDEERVSAGEEVLAALDHVGDEIAEVIETEGWDDLKASAFRTAGAFLEEDARPHLNAFITALRERALPAGGGVAGGALLGYAGQPPWLVVTVVAAGLLRSLFPWIFPRRPPPEG